MEEKRKNSIFRDTFLNNLLFVTISTLLVEIIFKLISGYEVLSYSTLRILFSTFILAFLFTTISFLMPKKWLKNTINLFYISLYSVYAYIQLGFLNYLGVYISFNTSNLLFRKVP